MWRPHVTIAAALVFPSSVWAADERFDPIWGRSSSQQLRSADRVGHNGELLVADRSSGYVNFCAFSIEFRREDKITASSAQCSRIRIIDGSAPAPGTHTFYSPTEKEHYTSVFRNNRYTYFAINQTERSVQYCVNDTTAKPDFPGNRAYYCITAKLDVD